MRQLAKKILSTAMLALFVAGCSSTASQPDYRYDEQKRGAEKAQKELSREVNKRY